MSYIFFVFDLLDAIENLSTNVTRQERDRQKALVSYRYIVVITNISVMSYSKIKFTPDKQKAKKNDAHTDYTV